jgi:UDP-glucose 4-epimerase
VDSNKSLPLAINVGTGLGSSVREVINLVFTAAGISEVSSIEVEPRAGDPSILCADVGLIYQSIQFESKFSILESIASLFGKSRVTIAEN